MCPELTGRKQTCGKDLTPLVVPLPPQDERLPSEVEPAVEDAGRPSGGDAQRRTARSNICGLKKLGAHVIVCGSQAWWS